MLALSLCSAGVVAAADEPPPALAGEPDPFFDDFDDEFERLPSGFPDPLEGSNRAIFRFNSALDRWLLDPITRAYGFIMPGPAKRAVRRVFVNLGEPGTAFNDVLQLEWQDAGVATSRFVINTTVGIAGLFDPASAIGLEHHRSDFGQTLTLAAAPSGPYLVVPVLGPTNVRDGSGTVADMAVHPLTWFLGPTNLLLYGVYGGGQGLSTREQHVEQIKALREGSIDYYAAMRNAYYQDRVANIWARREDRRYDWGTRNGDDVGVASY